MTEREPHKKAFEFYYALGEGRSYRQVAEELSVSLGTVKLWGRSFDWKGRISDSGTPTLPGLWLTGA